MPRELIPEIEAMIATGHVRRVPTLEIVLGDGNILNLSTAQRSIAEYSPGGGPLPPAPDGGGMPIDPVGGGPELEPPTLEINVDFSAYIDTIDVTELGVDQSVDSCTFEVSNVDHLIGQLVTSNENPLPGAKLVIGSLFMEVNDPLVGYIDRKLPCELSTGEVSKTTVAGKALSEIDAAFIAGDLISEEFPYRTGRVDINSTNTPVDDGSLINRPHGAVVPGTYHNGDGRYGPFQPLVPFVID